MSEWVEKKLGKLIYINPESISGNNYFGHIQYIDISSVEKGHLLGYTEYEFSKAPGRAKRKISNGDTIYSTVRPNLRAYWYVRDCPENAIVSTGFAVLRAKKNYDKRFVYYLVSEKSFVDYLSLVAKGSNYPAVDTNDFIKAKVIVPPRQTQTRIAEILSAYDDAIENNNRRIALLEKAARELFREWFVRLRFPGHESVKFVDGLPDGWEMVKLYTLYDTTSGGTPSRSNSKYYESGTVPWIKTGELNDRFVIGTEEAITEDAIKNSSAKRIMPDSLVLAMYGATIGKMGFTVGEMTCNQACCVFIPKTIEYTKEYLFQWLSSNLGYIIGIGFGAAQQNLSQDLIKRLKIMKPDSTTVIAFTSHITPMYKAILQYQQQSQNLARQRDLLLPRLMSGQLEV